MADVVQCDTCGKIRARFDNHVGSCIHCTNCSIASPCGICCQWPAENWQSLASRLERRKRARARVSRLQVSDTPPEKMMKPSTEDASPSTGEVVASPPPLPLSPPLPTISSEAPQDVLTTILGHLSAVTASLDASGSNRPLPHGRISIGMGSALGHAHHLRTMDSGGSKETYQRARVRRGGQSLREVETPSVRPADSGRTRQLDCSCLPKPPRRHQVASPSSSHRARVRALRRRLLHLGGQTHTRDHPPSTCLPQDKTLVFPSSCRRYQTWQPWL